MMGTHQLIFGSTKDFITGATVADTDDERARQQIARLLVEQKGYAKSDIDSRLTLKVPVDGDSGIVPVDFVIRMEGVAFMVILFRPGSIVTRERATAAVARLLEPYVIPYAVITNAHDASIMATMTGKVAGRGLDAVFSKSAALRKLQGFEKTTLTKPQRQKEFRILFTMEVLTERECSEYTCGRIDL